MYIQCSQPAYFFNSLIEYDNSYTTIIHVQRFIDAGITTVGDLVDFNTFNFLIPESLSGQIKTISHNIAMTIFNKIWSSLLNGKFIHILFNNENIERCIYFPDVALDCMSSSKTVYLSCYRKRLFYDYKLAMAFKDK